MLRFKIFCLFLFFSCLNVEASSTKIERVFEYIKNSSWDKAQELAREIGEPALIKIVLSRKFLRSETQDSNFQEIINFVQQNPNWPEINKIAKKAESYLSNDVDADLIIKWFRNRTPLTGKGYKFYALAIFKIGKKKAEMKYKLTKQDINIIIKDGWIYGDFDENEQKEYLKIFHNELDEKDRLRRIENLLWNNDTKGIRPLLYLVNKHNRKIIKAHLLLLTKPKLCRKIFNDIPKKDRTESIVLHYLQNCSHDFSDEEIVALINEIEENTPHADKWFNIIRRYAYDFAANKDFVAAYKIATKKLRYKKLEHEVDLVWFAGFVSLRFLKSPDNAIRHFLHLDSITKKAISKSRAYYWLARAYAAKGNSKTARVFYEKASNYAGTYYGQLAIDEIGKKFSPNIYSNINQALSQKIFNNEIVKAAYLIYNYDNYNTESQSYFEAAIESLEKPDEIVSIFRIAGNGNKDLSNKEKLTKLVKLAKLAAQRNVIIPSVSFPRPYKLPNEYIDSALTYAIIRQESGFDVAAFNDKSDTGLMQLLESTAQDVAKELNIKFELKRLRTDPFYNMKLGRYYMYSLIKQWEGSLVLAITSYNAGRSKVKKWIDLIGDPRLTKNLYDVIDWIELIPYPGTRNHFQRIIENLQIYRKLITKNDKLLITKDLIGSYKY